MRHYAALGFAKLLLYLDDPEDAAGEVLREGGWVDAGFVELTDVDSDLRAAWPSLPSWGRVGSHCGMEVQSRQLLGVLGSAWSRSGPGRKANILEVDWGRPGRMRDKIRRAGGTPRSHPTPPRIASQPLDIGLRASRVDTHSIVPRHSVDWRESTGSQSRDVQRFSQKAQVFLRYVSKVFRDVGLARTEFVHMFEVTSTCFRGLTLFAFGRWQLCLVQFQTKFGTNLAIIRQFRSISDKSGLVARRSPHVVRPRQHRANTGRTSDKFGQSRSSANIGQS